MSTKPIKSAISRLHLSGTACRFQTCRCGRGNYSTQNVPTGMQIPMAIIIRFSVSETKPSGRLLDLSTQAHLSSRLPTYGLEHRDRAERADEERDWRRDPDQRNRSHHNTRHRLAERTDVFVS